MNVWRLGDPAELKLPWAINYFPVTVIGFPRDQVLVEAVCRSDEIGVENEWIVPFSCLRRPLVRP